MLLSIYLAVPLLSYIFAQRTNSDWNPEAYLCRDMQLYIQRRDLQLIGLPRALSQSSTEEDLELFIQFKNEIDRR